MKNVLLVLLLLVLNVFSLKAQNKIVAQILNFENNKGVCRACLFNSAASFSGDGGEPFRCLQLPVKGKAAEAVFENIPSGNYAIFVFHDENANNKIDKNFVGIPKEGYGASKNKLPFAGAPTFEENKFYVAPNRPTTLTIKLRNL